MMYKYIYGLVIFLMSFAVMADATVDPSIAGQNTYTLTCEYPIEREDGTPLAIGEIAQVNFFVEKDGAGGFVPAGVNTSACRQVYDLSQVVDGVYVYTATVTDTDGRESRYSDSRTTLTVKRLPNPKAPTGMSDSVS